VPLTKSDVNNFARALQRIRAAGNHSITESAFNKTQCNDESSSFINELPNEVAVVKNIERQVRKKLSSEEKAQIVFNYTVNQMGVCQIAKKYGCHYTTISKMLKRTGVTDHSTAS
jgi:hypothetical protein